MLRIFDTTGQEISPIPQGRLETLDNVGWFDLDNPTPDEERWVEDAVGIDIPSRDELRDIEPSSRLYTENGALFLTASLAYRTDTAIPGLTDVGFILAGECLVTIRYAEPRAFAIFAASLGRTHDCGGGTDILVRLLETIVDRTAEILETSARRVDDISVRVFNAEYARPNRATRDLEATLSEIALLQQLVAKVRESLMSLSRISGYLQVQPAVSGNKKIKDKCRSVSRDIQSLSEHAGFISGNVTFMLDACLGLITVQQNNVMKIFSIAAVLLLPPTFIGAVYGMNFDTMPELHWQYGYPLALVAMVISGVVPLVWFRRKGWL